MLKFALEAESLNYNMTFEQYVLIDAHQELVRCHRLLRSTPPWFSTVHGSLCLRDELSTWIIVSNKATKAEILAFPAGFLYFHYAPEQEFILHLELAKLRNNDVTR